MGAVCYMDVNAVNLTCKMLFFVGCYVNPFRVAVNDLGQALFM